MSFDAYAVESRWGPHVTLQAGALHLGRHYTTTSRRSVKAQAARRRARASATRLRGDELRVVAGPMRCYDASRPVALAAHLLIDPLGGVAAPGGVVRIAGSNLAQVLGYLEAGREVPAGWLPWDRVVLAITGLDTLVLRNGVVVAAGGGWSSQVRRAVGAPARRRATAPVTVPDGVPGPAARLAGADGPCWVGISTPRGPVALPASWRADAGVAVVAPGLLDAVGAPGDGPACVTIDDSSQRRPDRKLGVMLRGDATVTADGTGASLVTLDVARVTWWRGFGSGTERVFDRAR